MWASVCAYEVPESPRESVRSHWALCHDTNSSHEDPTGLRDPRTMTLFVDPKFGTGATAKLLWTSRVLPAPVRMEQGRPFWFSMQPKSNLAPPIHTVPPHPPTPKRYPPSRYLCNHLPPEIHGPACSGLAHLSTNVKVRSTTSTFSEFRAAVPLRQASASPAPLLGTHLHRAHLTPANVASATAGLCDLTNRAPVHMCHDPMIPNGLHGPPSRHSGKF